MFVIYCFAGGCCIGVILGVIGIAAALIGAQKEREENDQ